MSGLAVRLSAVYAAYFAMTGLTLPYWPVWLKAQGITEREIGLLIAAGMVARVLSGPVFSAIADRYGARRRMILTLMAVSSAVFMLYLPASGFTAFLVINLLYMSVHPPVMPLVESITGRAAAAGRIDYGRVRLWGSLSFIVLVVAGGRLITATGADHILTACITCLLIAFLTCFLLPRDPVANKSAGSKVVVPVRMILHLAVNPLFLAFILSASLIQASHAVYYGFSAIHWTKQGFSGDLVGVLWATGVIAEIVLFAFSVRLFGRLNPLALVMMGGAFAAVRWTVTAFDPPLGVLVLCQIGHAFTFGATHIGTIQFIAKAVPEQLAGSGQSLYTSVAGGLIMAGASFAAGQFYSTFDAGAYIAMAMLGGIGAFGSLLVLRAWDGGELFSLAPARD